VLRTCPPSVVSEAMILNALIEQVYMCPHNTVCVPIH